MRGINLKNLEFFNSLYNESYNKTAAYIAARCDNLSQVSDIVQEIYLEIYNTINRKGTGYMTNPQGFVRQVAKAKLSRYYGKNKDKIYAPLILADDDDNEYDSTAIADGVNIEEQYITKELLSQIASFISKQPPLEGKIFYLYYYCDSSIEQIAISLNMKSSTVKTKLYRTLAKVRKLYVKEYKEL